MTIIEAINDLINNDDCDNRLAEDMFTRSRIYGDQPLDKQCVNTYSALSKQWITRDR